MPVVHVSLNICDTPEAEAFEVKRHSMQAQANTYAAATTTPEVSVSMAESS